MYFTNLVVHGVEQEYIFVAPSCIDGDIQVGNNAVLKIMTLVNNHVIMEVTCLRDIQGFLKRQHWKNHNSSRSSLYWSLHNIRREPHHNHVFQDPSRTGEEFMRICWLLLQLMSILFGYRKGFTNECFINVCKVITIVSWHLAIWYTWFLTENV